MSFVLPYTGIIKTTENFSPRGIDAVVSQCLGLNSEMPCYIELKEADTQWFLFLREGQIYTAGRIQEQNLENASIKEFFIGCSEFHELKLRICSLNNKILHSILILFQKKPSIKTLTSLVDLDNLLDKIEEGGKSCIVSATQDSFLAILRYEKGRVTALCHEHTYISPKESTFREDFLVKIYTLSVEKQLLISLYEDLLVKFATDAKIIDKDYKRSPSDLFFAKPPILLLKLKGRELGRWSLDKNKITIGRSYDSDIVIDNLAVSRIHAIIEEDKGTYHIKDCDSLNGTLLNGKKIGRAHLDYNDEIIIGKHSIFLKKQEGIEIPESAEPENYDRTFVISPEESKKMTLLYSKNAHNPCEGGGPNNSKPRLIEQTPQGERVIELLKPSIIIGKDQNADIPLSGLFVADKHAEITKEGDKYVIRHLNGMRKVKVCGRSVNESVLKSEDKITIANKEFTFIE